MRSAFVHSALAMAALGVVPAYAQENATLRLAKREEISIPALKSNWQPIPALYSYIRTWYDGAGFQVAVSDVQPHKSVGWMESPTFTVPPPASQNDGNITTLVIDYTFTGGYTGVAPEMRVRLHTFDMSQYATASVTSSRFNQLRGASQGQVTVTFDRRNLPTAADTTMWFFVDLISDTTAGNADPNFHFRINKATVSSWSPVASSSQRITSSYIEGDGDVYAYFGGGTSRTRLMTDSQSYAVDGSGAIVVKDRNLWYFGPQVGNTGKRIHDNGQVKSASISDEHVVWVETDNEVRYYNANTDTSRRLASSGRDWLGVVPQGNGGFVIIETVTGGRSFWLFDGTVAGSDMRRLSDDDDGLYVNVGTTGVISTTKGLKEADVPVELLSTSWMISE